MTTAAPVTLYTDSTNGLFTIRHSSDAPDWYLLIIYTINTLSVNIKPGSWESVHGNYLRQKPLDGQWLRLKSNFLKNCSVGQAWHLYS